MNNNRKAIKSGFWYTLSVFLIKGIGFITTPIFTRLLTKAEFGLFNNYTSWLSIITVIITLNLEATLISARFDYEDSFDSYILSMIGLGGVSTIAGGIIICFFMGPISSFTHLDPIYIVVMLTYLLFSPSVNMFITRERYLFKYKSSMIVSIIIALSTAFLSVILVLNLSNRLTGRIIGSAAPTIILGFTFLLYFINSGKRIKIKYWKYAIPICLPYIPHLLAGTLLNSMDRVMIERYCGAEDTAIYSLAYTCGTIVTLLITALNNAFAPWMGEKMHNGEYQEINKFANIYVIIFMGFAFGIMLVAPDILLILGGEPYQEAKYVITPVAMGCVCQFLYTLYVNIEQFKKKTVGMAIATVIAAIVNFLLNLLFIPRIGYLAAAYTTLIGFLSLLLMHIILVNRIGFGSVYNIRLVIACIIFGIIGMILITISYNYILMRICLIIIYIILIGINFLRHKDAIMNIISKRKI